MPKHFKNTSGVEDVWIGQVISDLDSYEIEPEEEHKWKKNGKVEADVLAGNAEVGDGVNWYTLQQALDFLNDTIGNGTIVLSTDPGWPGQICYDSSFLYVCTALNTWKRIALVTW